MTLLTRFAQAIQGALAIHAPDLSSEDRAFVRRYLDKYTMTSPERVIGLRDAVRYVVKSHLPGAIVECGVWRGGSMMVVADTLAALDATNRELWLYDTFSGMPPGSAHDTDWFHRSAAFYARMIGPSWCAASLAEVQQNISGTGYPQSLTKYIQGPVEQTIPHTLPDSIALLRLDTDFYESTRHELDHLYPRLVAGGVLLLDDYGYWAGARRAVDEYFGENGPLLMRLDSSGRLAIKPF